MKMYVDDTVRLYMLEHPQDQVSLTLNTNWQMYKRVPDAVSKAMLDQAIIAMETTSGGKIELGE